MMDTVLVILMPVRSHFNAVTGLAKALKMGGARLAFTGGIDESLDNYIQCQGYRTVPFKGIPFALSYHDELDFLRRYGLGSKQLLLRRITGVDYRERLTAYRQLLLDLQPSVIILDAFMGADFLCIREAATFYNPRFCFVNTMCARTESERALESNQPGFLLEKLLLKKTSHLRRHLQKLYANIFQFGYTSQRIITKAISTQAINKALIVQDNSPVSLTFEGIPELVLSAAEFNIPAETAPENRHFIGSWINKDRIDFMAPEQKQLLYELLNKKSSIIYVSLGTQQNRSASLVITFIEKIAGTACLLDNCIFVIANAPKKIQDNKMYQHKNIFYFDSIPQLVILERAQVFVTHGGLNSIKESINFSVPMLLYPVNKKYDQLSNVRKAAFHQLGLSASGKDSVLTIAGKLNRLMNDPLFKEAGARMKSAMGKSPSTGQIRDKFKYIFPCTSPVFTEGAENKDKFLSFTYTEMPQSSETFNDN